MLWPAGAHNNGSAACSSHGCMESTCCDAATCPALLVAHATCKQGQQGQQELAAKQRALPMLPGGTHAARSRL